MNIITVDLNFYLMDETHDPLSNIIRLEQAYVLQDEFGLNVVTDSELDLKISKSKQIKKLILCVEDQKKNKLLGIEINFLKYGDKSGKIDNINLLIDKINTFPKRH